MHNCSCGDTSHSKSIESVDLLQIAKNKHIDVQSRPKSVVPNFPPGKDLKRKAPKIKKDIRYYLKSGQPKDDMKKDANKENLH